MANLDRHWLHHGTPDWVRPDQEVFFVTICAGVRGTQDLVRTETATALIDSVKRRHELLTWSVHLFLVMPDHVHGLITFPRTGRGMVHTVASWKRWTSRSLRIKWQRGFFDHRLRGNEGFEEKAHYVRMNPVRAGLVEAAEAWPHIWSPYRSQSSEIEPDDPAARH